MLQLSWTSNASGATGLLMFDVVSAETHEALMAVTEHPVEDGVDVVDNARPKPKTITINGFVSNKPLPTNPNASGSTTGVALDFPQPHALNLGGVISQGLNALQNAAFSALGPIASAIGLSPSGVRPSGASVWRGDDSCSQRAIEMYQALLSAQSEIALITVSTSMSKIDNMVINKVGVPRTSETGNGADFEVQLTQVRIVSSQTIEVPAEARGGKKQALGSQSGTQDDGQDSDRKDNATSVLKSATDASGGTAPGSGIGP